MASESEEDIYAVEKLYCTLCRHDLNHTIYQIFRHPVLEVPLCIICHQTLWESDLFADTVDTSELCTWCGDGGDLFLCDDAEKCNRAFCRDCLTANLGEGAVQIIEEADRWFCLCCIEHPTMAAFARALQQGTENSVYNQSGTPGTEGTVSEAEVATPGEEQVARDLYILQAVVKESNAALVYREDGTRRDKLAQIADELRTVREGRYVY
jgi:hypothetical protein